MTTARTTARRFGAHPALVLAMALACTAAVLLATASPARATVFSNGGAITVNETGCGPPDAEAATPYPSNITVSGLSGTVTDVNVTLSGVTHPFEGDLEILLVSPAGGTKNLVVLSDAGTGSLSNAAVTFDDSAAAQPPQNSAWGPGTYKPVNYFEVSGADSFPGPAPAASSNTTLAAAFNGIAPNGTWSLYVVDDACGDGGSIGGGWSLDITTAALTATTTSVVSSLNPSRTGQSVTFTSTTTAGGPVPSGTVTFTDGATTLAANVAVDSSGQAAFTTAALTEGNHLIKATYNANATFATSNGTVDQRVDNNTTVTPPSQWCNTGAVTIADNTTATPYPSNIFVTGGPASLGDVNVTLKNVSHTFDGDIEALLVGPAGQNLVIVSDAGTAAITNVTVNLDDAASGPLPVAGAWAAPNATTTVKPTNYNEAIPDSFPGPAPAPTAATALSTFNGTNANGTWSLYVKDDGAPDSGSIAGGWCLNLTGPPPPAVPTNVVATATSSTRIALTWDAVVGATSYEIDRSEVAGGPYGDTRTVTTNSYDNTGRTPDTTYYYVVRAVGVGGTSANSAEASAHTPALPAAPTGVVASTVNATRVNVSWNPVAGAAGYEVSHSTTSGGPYVKVATVPGTSFLHTGAVPGTTNYYVVRTVVATGSSVNSAQASAVTPPLPVPPGNVVATALTPTRVSVTWDPVAGATAYEVWRATVSGGPYVKKGTVPGTSFTDTAAASGTTYYYVVRTVTGAGTSANSAQATATTP
jgi:subtilisin-like proprotein convertase family protein